MLEVRDVVVRYAALTAVDGATLDVADGEVLALLGPSGCGKSTLLRAIAGLEPLAGGSVCWDGVDLARIPVHRRGFGLMFQDGVLFPHRSVAGNVAYGLRGRSDAGRRVTELLELVGLSGYGPRRVATLSGGEAQRVALARALAPRPRLLLLDEPLAALDRALREQLLADLREVLATTGTTAIFVTHDQTEAFALANRVAVMRSGRIVQAGAPAVVWSRPADEWTARFLGCGAVLDARPEREVDGSWCSVTDLGAVPGRATRVGLRPTALVVDPAGPLRGEVAAVVPGPERQRLTLRLGGAAFAGAGVVQAVASPDVEVVVGGRVPLRFDPDGAALVGAESVPPGDDGSRGSTGSGIGVTKDSGVAPATSSP